MKRDTRTREQIFNAVLAEGIRIQPYFRPEPTLKTTGRGSYKGDTVAEIARAIARSR